MPRKLLPDALHPILKFRFLVTTDQLPGLKFYGKSTDLPKWTSETQWKNLIKIRCYHFEGITVNELSKLDKKNIKLTIAILDPAEDVIYEWRLVGDIVGIDYGKMDRSFDEVTEAEISFMPNECIVAFDPKEI